MSAIDGGTRRWMSMGFAPGYVHGVVPLGLILADVGEAIGSELLVVADDTKVVPGAQVSLTLRIDRAAPVENHNGDYVEPQLWFDTPVCNLVVPAGVRLQGSLVAFSPQITERPTRLETPIQVVGLVATRRTGTGVYLWLQPVPPKPAGLTGRIDYADLSRLLA